MMSSCVVAYAVPADIAVTTAGMVRGRVEKGVIAFRGVPYGADTAKRRFRTPEPVEKWEGVRDCLELGPIAPQPAGTSKTAFRRADLPQSEDCLNLNIWTPALRDERKRPVFVYFHGGGFDLQSANLIDGAALARRGDAVLIGVNHRLGGFGFLFLESIAGTEFAGSANAGLQDLVLALQWVRQNVAEFGGDPGCVTIWGDSGGAGKCVALMTMPAAHGLFQRVWTISGALLAGLPPDTASAQTRYYLQRLKFSEHEFDQITRLPMEQLIEAFDKPFGPVIDGTVLPRDPFMPDAAPLSADIPMVIGTTHDEMSSFLVKRPELANVTWENIVSAMASVGMRSLPNLNVERLVAEYRRIYPDYSPTEVVWAISTASGIWRVTVVESELRAKQGGPTWAYCLDWPGRGKAAHAIDSVLVVGDPNQNWRTAAEPTGQAMADIMSDSFIAFGRTGNPNTAALPKWPSFNTDERPTMIFDLPSRVENDPRSEERKLFDERLN
jgi:para-nitrobenzyl esterase